MSKASLCARPGDGTMVVVVVVVVVVECTRGVALNFYSFLLVFN